MRNWGTRDLKLSSNGTSEHSCIFWFSPTNKILPSKHHCCEAADFTCWCSVLGLIYTLGWFTFLISGVFLDLTSVSVSSFIVCSHQSFLCLFGHSNHFLEMLAETRKPVRCFTHRWVEEWICCVKSQTVGRLWFFKESRLGCNTANARAQSPLCYFIRQ